MKPLKGPAIDFDSIQRTNARMRTPVLIAAHVVGYSHKT